MRHHLGSQVSRVITGASSEGLRWLHIQLKVKTLKLLDIISLLFFTNYTQKSVSQFICVNFISGLKTGKKNPIKIQHISVITIITSVFLKNNLLLNLCNANDCKHLIGKIDQGLINLNKHIEE